jgi:hypothetical protein
VCKIEAYLLQCHFEMLNLEGSLDSQKTAKEKEVFQFNVSAALLCVYKV